MGSPGGMALDRAWAALTRRNVDEDSPVNEFVKLISSPFQSAFQINAVWLSFGTSIGFAVFLTLLFSLVRPHHTVVYAPKVKHADRRHAPPPAGKGIFSWVKPVLRAKESELVDSIGLDAIVFLRFTKMCRNMFLVMSIVGCAVMIPINIILSRSNSYTKGLSVFATMTPQYVSTNGIWSQVICAWIFDIIVALFLWWNYKAVLALRRRYFQSSDYQRSLHARTLMITDIPPAARSDEGLMLLTDKVNPTAAIPRTAIGRNVKGLPRLIKEHEEAVRHLESVLAKYLKRPDRLPAKRPTIRPPRKEGTRGRVDAIDYLTTRIRLLEDEIGHVRASIDKRNVMPFGFASWEMIEHAHTVAYASRNTHPQGTTIRLAPRPSDIIWENLPLSKATRGWKRFINVIWVIALTIVWVAPNALIAVFLSNLNNLGLVWPAFSTSLEAHPKLWAAVQGIASPALTSLVYLILPIIFRRLAIHAGNVTKTARENEVLSHLYSFFVFNNLIVFSLFSAAWTFVTAVIDATKHNKGAWEAVKEGHLFATAFKSLCQVSPFFVVWLLQRSLGATIDLVQLVNLTWVWFSKTFLAPTPRQAIEWTAPPPFDYASYCNYFLYYATVALCFATLQPIVLPVTAFYFGLDAVLKKYLLMYVFVTKNESGGRFWRLLFNRMIFATILANFIVALAARANGTWTMVYCMVPLPFLMLGFKLYCMRTFDHDIHYYNRNILTDTEELAAVKLARKASEGLSTKFGHPALYKPLITPMVHARAVDALKSIYQGRLDPTDHTGEYSDIVMDRMAAGQPGKSMYSTIDLGPFEFVPENHLDFSYFKDRPDFRDEFGGGIYGRPEDLISERSQTPRMFKTAGDSRSSSPAPSFRSGSGMRMHDGFDLADMRTRDQEYTAFSSPLARYDSGPVPTSGGLYYQSNESETELLSHAQAPSHSAAPLGRWRTGGYGRVQQDDSSFAPDDTYHMR